MAPVLAITGIFLYQRFGSDLDRAIDSGLRSRAADVRALIGESDSGLREGRLNDRAESFAEIIELDGRLVDSTAQLRGRVLLSAAERRRAAKAAVFLDRPASTTLRDASRLLAVPVRSNGRPMIAVVGTSTETRADSLSDLLGVLLLGGPIALLLASLAAYGGAGAALRPVEAMRPRRRDIRGRSRGTPSRLAGARRDRTAGEHPECDARAPGRGARTRASVRGGCQPRATHAAGDPQDRARACARRRPHARGAARRAGFGRRGDRPAHAAGRGSAAAGPDRRRQAAGRARARRARRDARDVVERFARRAHEGRREIEIACTEDLSGRFDRLRLEQALGNLLDNSLRYGAGAIELRAQARDGRVEIHVADRGKGFPAGFTERAFERFSRPADTRSTSGAGLGMAIVESIAIAHGGSAHAANRPAGGADVWLDLPRPTDAPARRRTTPHPAEA